MTKPSFSKGVNGPNGDIYMRLLRESIIDELKLTDSTKESDLEINNHFITQNLEAKITKENFYNLNHLNNEEAIGYNNLKERAQNPDDNWNIAHDNVFDQMLAEYFLEKRGNVKKGNKLLSDLTEEFNNKPSKYGDSKANKPFGEHYLEMTIEKDD
jgi:hypothetical protein